MRITSGLTLIFFSAIMVCGLNVAGCKGSDDSAPTNTKNSKYMGGGDTEADKVGAARAKARLPHGGQPPQ